MKVIRRLGGSRENSQRGKKVSGKIVRGWEPEKEEGARK